jgi:predicted dinucleotide-binding enzyme
MEIGILGTGGVAQTLPRRWSVAGHQVTLGSRDPSSKGDLGSHVAPLIDAAADHDVVVNTTPGFASLELAKGIGAAALAGKILIDVANANTRVARAPTAFARYMGSSENRHSTHPVRKRSRQ